MLARIDAAGDPVGEASVIVEDSRQPRDMVWTGSVLGVMYGTYISGAGYDIRLAPVHSSGLIEDTDFVIHMGLELFDMAIEWTGSEIGVAWGQATAGFPDDHGLYLGRIAFCD